MGGFALTSPMPVDRNRKPKVVRRRKKSVPVQSILPDDREWIGNKMILLGMVKEGIRFKDCRSRLLLLRCRHEHRIFGLLETCKSRICPECQNAVRRQFHRTWFDYLKSLKREKGKTYRLLTLTLWSSGKPEDVEISKSFKLVRQFCNIVYGNPAKKRTMRQCGNGAVGVAEVGKRWNLHFHLLVYGPRVPKAQMVQTWRELTGNSFVVDIQTVWDLKKGLWEVIKYIGKIPFYDSAAQYVEWIQILRGCRRLHTFGILYNAVRMIREKLKRECPFCGGRLLMDGFSYRWGNHPKLHWWARLLCRGPGEGIRFGGEVDPDDPPPKVSSMDWRFACRVVGFMGLGREVPGCPDEFIEGFFIPRRGVDFEDDPAAKCDVVAVPQVNEFCPPVLPEKNRLPLSLFA